MSAQHVEITLILHLEADQWLPVFAMPGTAAQMEDYVLPVPLDFTRLVPARKYARHAVRANFQT